MKPACGPSERATYVYSPPADGISFASCPIDDATQAQPTRASSTESGRAGPANWIDTKIENAIAAPGAMWVIAWNRTCGSPIASRRSSPGALPASMFASSSVLSGAILRPGRRIVNPPAADHRRDNLALCEVLDRIVRENDQIGEVAGQELATAALGAFQPRGRHAGRLECLLDRQRLFRVPRLALVLGPQDAGADARDRIQLLHRRAGAVRDHGARVQHRAVCVAPIGHPPP